MRHDYRPCPKNAGEVLWFDNIAELVGKHILVKLASKPQTVPVKKDTVKHVQSSAAVLLQLLVCMRLSGCKESLACRWGSDAVFQT